METEAPAIAVQEEDAEPVFFAPKRVSLISDIASITSWVVLVGFLGTFALNIVSLQSQIKTNNYAIADLLKEPSFFVYLFTNLVTPLLTGLVFFLVLQAAAVGLNILLEKEFDRREAKSKAKA